MVKSFFKNFTGPSFIATSVHCISLYHCATLRRIWDFFLYTLSICRLWTTIKSCFYLLLQMILSPASTIYQVVDIIISPFYVIFPTRGTYAEDSLFFYCHKNAHREISALTCISNCPCCFSAKSFPLQSKHTRLQRGKGLLHLPSLVHSAAGSPSKLYPFSQRYVTVLPTVLFS